MSIYRLNEYHIASDLFIFGLPGLVATILIYRYQLDTKVIRTLYAGLILTIAGLLVLMANLPLWLAECLLAVMSIGFGCSQPLFIGILRLPPAGINPIRPMAMGGGMLFAGYGSGPLVMIALLGAGMTVAIVFLVLLVIALAFVSRHVWAVSGTAKRI